MNKQEYGQKIYGSYTQDLTKQEPRQASFFNFNHLEKQEKQISSIKSEMTCHYHQAKQKQQHANAFEITYKFFSIANIAD